MMKNSDMIENHPFRLCLTLYHLKKKDQAISNNSSTGIAESFPERKGGIWWRHFKRFAH
jgi:hypothetical protein